MQSRKVPALLALAGVLVAVVLFLVLQEDTADENTTLPADSARQAESSPVDEGDEGRPQPTEPQPERPEVPTVRIRDAEPVGGPLELKVRSGGQIRLRVIADAADELHLHGYDEYLQLEPGEPATLRVPATIEGLFELESHSTGALIAEISVVPA